MKIVVCGLLVAVAFATRVRAQSEAGTVAAVVGTLQLQRAGTWQNAEVGVPVYAGDRLKTGATDRAKVVFADDSVLDVGPDTEVALDKQVFDATGRHYQSLLRLAKGKIRAWVSEYYRESRARYEVETPTAIAGVRGTEFIVSYSASAEVTEIVGIENQVEVVGKLGVIGSTVQVGPRLYTEVRKGRFPTAPQRIDDARLQQYLDGLDIVGTGRRDGLNVFHPATIGRLLAATDLPKEPLGKAPGLAAGAPQMFLADTVSADVYTNTQPLLQYRQLIGGAGTGSVKVGVGF